MFDFLLYHLHRAGKAPVSFSRRRLPAPGPNLSTDTSPLASTASKAPVNGPTSTKPTSTQPAAPTPINVQSTNPNR
jgi:hypothetical protein